MGPGFHRPRVSAGRGHGWLRPGPGDKALEARATPAPLRWRAQLPSMVQARMDSVFHDIGAIVPRSAPPHYANTDEDRVQKKKNTDEDRPPRPISPPPAKACPSGAQI